jgi:hypothetical protein
MPRFMEASGPTDPMALLMRQRIVFLGTQARLLRHPRAWVNTRCGDGVGAALRGAVAARRRLLGATLSPGVARSADAAAACSPPRRWMTSPPTPW